MTAGSPAPAGTRPSIRAPGCRPTPAGSRRPTAPAAAPTQVAQAGGRARARGDARSPGSGAAGAVGRAIATLREIDPGNPQLTVRRPRRDGCRARQTLDRLDAADQSRCDPTGDGQGDAGWRADRGTRKRPRRSATAGRSRMRPKICSISSASAEHSNLPGRMRRRLKLAWETLAIVTFRPISGSRDPAIDVNVPGARLKIHFP